MPKASDNIKIYRNPNGPVVSTVNRRVLEQDGLTFKDIDGTGTLSQHPAVNGGLADGQVPHHRPHGGPI